MMKCMCQWEPETNKHTSFMLESNDIIIPIVEESVFDYKLFAFTAFDPSNTKRSMSKLRHVELILLHGQQQILRISIVISLVVYSLHDMISY